jgi:hypothetical protein
VVVAVEFCGKVYIGWIAGNRSRDFGSEEADVSKLFFVFCLVVSLFTLNAVAAEMTGYISDSKCTVAHMDGSQKSINCVKQCVKAGQQPVFVTPDKKVLKLADTSKVMNYLGEKVTVDGSVAGDTLTIKSIKKAS